MVKVLQCQKGDKVPSIGFLRIRIPAQGQVPASMPFRSFDEQAGINSVLKGPLIGNSTSEHMADALKAGGGSAISKQLSKYGEAFNSGTMRHASKLLIQRSVAQIENNFK